MSTRFEPPTEFVLPGENRVAAALDLARTTVRRAERACVTATPRRLARAREPGRAVPQPARRPVLDSRPLAGGRVPRRPRRVAHRCPRSSLTLEELRADLVHRRVHRARPRPRRRPRRARHRRPDARCRRRRGRGRVPAARSPRSWSDAGFEGKPGQTLFVPLERPGGERAARGRRPGRRRDARRPAHRRGARRPAGVGARPASRRRSPTPRPTRSTRPRSGRRSPRACCSAATRSTSTAPPRRPPSSARSRVLVDGGAAAVKKGVARGEVVAGAVAWARDMVNTPARELSPDQFAKAAQQLLRGKNVKVEVLDVAAMKRQKLGGVLGVGQGSKQPPRLVKMTYSPPRAKGSLALVGKGVVFDSGGLSLKTGARHGDDEDRHGRRGRGDRRDVGAVRLSASRTKVVGYTPMVENMPSGDAIRPGDVLTFRNGKTVEVLNTDAEGRLILADALALAAEEKPDAIVDLATLTGACVVALGEKIAGLMANDEAFGEQVEDAAEARRRADVAAAAAEGVPQDARLRDRRHEEHQARRVRRRAHRRACSCRSSSTTCRGCTSTSPGPARAGADDGYTRRGGTGFGVRTLLELATRRRHRRVAERAPAGAAHRHDASRGRPRSWSSSAARASRRADEYGNAPVVTVRMTDNEFAPQTVVIDPGHRRALGQRRAQQAQRHRRRQERRTGRRRRRSSRQGLRPPVRRARRLRVLVLVPRRAAHARCTARSSCATPTARVPAAVKEQAPKPARRRERAHDPRAQGPADDPDRGRPRRAGRPDPDLARRLPRGGHGHDRRPRASAGSTATA